MPERKRANKPDKIEVDPADFEMIKKFKEMGQSGDLLNMTTAIAQQMQLAEDTYVSQHNTYLVTHRIMVMIENIYKQIDGMKNVSGKKIVLPHLVPLQILVKQKVT